MTPHQCDDDDGFDAQHNTATSVMYLAEGLTRRLGAEGVRIINSHDG